MRGLATKRAPSLIFRVPRARFELARLTAPPPQDGVSTNSTTWAKLPGFLSKWSLVAQETSARACKISGLRYPSSMNRELRQGEVRDLEMSDACVNCGGPLSTRFTARTARGVCIDCHLVTNLLVVQTPEGVRVLHAPLAVA